MPHTHGLRPSEPSASVQLTSQPTNSSATFRRLVTVNQELAQHNAKLRHDLSEARRRAAVAANAETQAGIAVALHREKHAEAARLRCELLNSLQDARDEISKLKIQVNAQASLLNLQRALATSPTRSNSPSSVASPASSRKRRDENECDVSTEKDETVSPRPQDMANQEVTGTALGVSPACTYGGAAVIDDTIITRQPDMEIKKTNDEEDASETSKSLMPPPARRHVNLRGFAAGGETSAFEVLQTEPASRGGVGQTGAHPHAGTATTPRRALRERIKNVVYTEPSLKTKMRRPRETDSETRNENRGTSAEVEPTDGTTTDGADTAYSTVDTVDTVDSHLSPFADLGTHVVKRGSPFSGRVAITPNSSDAGPRQTQERSSPTKRGDLRPSTVGDGVDTAECSIVDTVDTTVPPFEPVATHPFTVDTHQIDPTDPVFPINATEEVESEEPDSTPVAHVTSRRHRRRFIWSESPETPVDGLITQGDASIDLNPSGDAGIAAVNVWHRAMDEELVTIDGAMTTLDDASTPPDDASITQATDEDSPLPAQPVSVTRSLSWSSGGTGGHTTGRESISSDINSERGHDDENQRPTESASTSPENARPYPRRASQSIGTYCEPSVNRKMRQ